MDNSSILSIGKLCRNNEQLHLHSYLTGEQYNSRGLYDWNYISEPVPYYKKKPKIIVPVPDNICKYIANQLFGEDKAPLISSKLYQDAVIKVINEYQLFNALQQATKYLVCMGSVLLRHYVSTSGKPMCRVVAPYMCYPTFDDNTCELSSVYIRNIYTDSNTGKRMLQVTYLSRDKDVLFKPVQFSNDNTAPRVGWDDSMGIKPNSGDVDQVVDHKNGIVSATWLSMNTQPTNSDFDGDSFIKQYTGMFDDLNYQTSTLSDTILYSQTPQMYVTGVNPDSNEIDVLKNPKYLWVFSNSEAKVNYVEPRLDGAEVSKGYIDDVYYKLSTLTGVPLSTLRSNGSAPSGEALTKLLESTVNMIQGFANTIKPQLATIVAKLISVHCNKEYKVSDVSVSWGDFVSESAEITNVKIQNIHFAKENGYISDDEAKNKIRDQLKIEV